MFNINTGPQFTDISTTIEEAAEAWVDRKKGFYNGVYETHDPSKVADAIGAALIDLLESLSGEDLIDRRNLDLSWYVNKRLNSVPSIEMLAIAESDFDEELIAA